MGVDQLDLLGLGHRVGDLAGPLEQPRHRAERARDGQSAEEPRRALEQRRQRRGEDAGRDGVEDGHRRQRGRGGAQRHAGVAHGRSSALTSRPPRGSSRCRTRAATTRRYSAVERTSSIGCELAGERLGGAVGDLGRRAAGPRGRPPSRGRGSASPPPTRAPRGRRARPRAAVAVPPGEGHDDLADRLGAARPDLAEADLASRRRAGSGSAGPARPGRAPSCDSAVQNVGGRDGPLAARRPSDDDRVRREQDRQRVAGRRGVGDVAAERAAVLDLGRADRRGRLDERRQVLAAERGAADLRVRRQRAEDERRRRRDAMPRSSSRRHRSSTPVRRLAELAGERDHQVRAAGDRPGGRRLGEEPRRRLGEVGRAGATGGSIGHQLDRAGLLGTGRAGANATAGDRLDDLRVAGAAAEVAGDRLADRVLVGPAAGIEVGAARP